MPKKTADEARHEMIVGLDRALHGTTTARDETPEAVWFHLLEEVRELVRDSPSHHNEFERAAAAFVALLGKFRIAK